MQHKSEENFRMIENFINDYADANAGATPSVRQIAERTGISKSSVSRYLSDMQQKDILRFSSPRGMSSRQLVRDSERSVRVPVLGSVACGIPKLAEENIEEYIKLPVSIFGTGDFFILHANGDSMVDAGIDDGDLVLVRKQNTAQYNQIVVALVEDEATLKRFRPQKDCIILHPENENYSDIVVSDCIIQGVAVKVLKDIG